MAPLANPMSAFYSRMKTPRQLTLTVKVIIFRAMRKTRQMSKGIVRLAEYRAQEGRRRWLRILIATLAAIAALVLVIIAAMVASNLNKISAASYSQGKRIFLGRVDCFLLACRSEG